MMSMATQEPHLRSHAVEDYAKAIYVLETRGSEPVSTTALAERLNVTAGSVSAMIKKLAEIDLVTHTPYRGVRLTPEGRRTALEIIRHHRLLELFLAEVLEMPWDRVHQAAEGPEPVLPTEPACARRPRCSSTCSRRSSRRSSPRSSGARLVTPTATRSRAPNTRSWSRR